MLVEVVLEVLEALLEEDDLVYFFLNEAGFLEAVDFAALEPYIHPIHIELMPEQLALCPLAIRVLWPLLGTDGLALPSCQLYLQDLPIDPLSHADTNVRLKLGDDALLLSQLLVLLRHLRLVEVYQGMEGVVLFDNCLGLDVEESHCLAALLEVHLLSDSDCL